MWILNIWERNRFIPSHIKFLSEDRMWWERCSEFSGIDNLLIWDPRKLLPTWLLWGDELMRYRCQIIVGNRLGLALWMTVGRTEIKNVIKNVSQGCQYERNKHIWTQKLKYGCQSKSGPSLAHKQNLVTVELGGTCSILIMKRNR